MAAGIDADAVVAADALDRVERGLERGVGAGRPGADAQVQRGGGQGDRGKRGEEQGS